LEYLIGVRSSDPYGIKEVFKAMRDGPKVQSHLVGHKSVGVIKQVNITPSERTVLLEKEQHTQIESKLSDF